MKKLLKMSNSITLRKSQFVNALQNCNSLLDNGICLDTTNVGLGKSIMLAWCLIRMKDINHKIMLCTSSLIPMWQDYNKKFNLNFLKIISYESLRSTRTKKNITLNHKLLKRFSDDSFEVTDYFKNLVEEGLVICCDESQKSKNTCDIQRAIKVMCSYIMRRRQILPLQHNICGVYFMSTTPFDKQEHLINFCYTVGIITKKPLISKETGKMLGLLELKDYCSNLDSEKTNNVIGTMSINYKNAENIAYQLCINIFLPDVSSFVNKVKLTDEELDDMIDMIDEKSSFDSENIEVTPYEDENEDDSSVKQTIYNTFCKITPIGLSIIKYGLSMIHSSSHSKVEVTEEMDDYYEKIICLPSPLKTRNCITHGIITIHAIKVYESICPMAMQYLNEVENSKIVIFLDYKESVEIAVRELAKYGVLTMTGDIKKTEDREHVRMLFQESNLNYRVLIATNQISSTGVEFDDKNGNFPRAGFSIEGYVISNAIQCPGRLKRQAVSKSNSLFFFIKVDDDDEYNYERSVDENIQKKSLIFRESLRDNGIIPPDSFINMYYNPDTVNFTNLLLNAGNEKYKSIEEKVLVKTNRPMIKQISAEDDCV